MASMMPNSNFPANPRPQLPGNPFFNRQGRNGRNAESYLRNMTVKQNVLAETTETFNATLPPDGRPTDTDIVLERILTQCGFDVVGTRPRP